MVSTGITRKIDELGRIVLPIELRHSLDIREKDSIDIRLEGDSIILRKVQTACVFCASVENITDFKGKAVCGTCIDGLKGL